MDSLSQHNSAAFKCAFQEVKNDSEKFKSSTQSTIFSVLSRYGCRELPTPANIYRLVNQVAKYQFLSVCLYPDEVRHTGCSSDFLEFNVYW